MSIPSPAIPSAVAVLQAVQQFITNLGTDPLQVAVKFPGAAQVFLGTVEMQLPVLANAEFSALQADVNAKIEVWIKKLQAPAV
jgi:propanediol dehydratase large subunit